jgi:hypothetical protein
MQIGENIEIVLAPVDGAEAVFVGVFENERTHRRVLDSSFVLLGRTWRRFGETTSVGYS